jgi:hypothetical protein
LLLVKATGYFGGLSLFSLSGAFKYGADIGSHPQYLAANVVVTLKTTLLLGICWSFRDYLEKAINRRVHRE